jgi:metallo-beta-lactamase superfamily protein
MRSPKGPVAKKGLTEASSMGLGSRLAVEPGKLVVRMYRQGLGDCFLLAFGTSDANDPRYVLVDCGIHKREMHGRDRLDQVLKDLAKATNRHLHIVVATHEHADHLSGFVQKGSTFLDHNWTIDELWMAWTEQVGDPQADELRTKRGTARIVIEKAIERLNQQPGAAGSASLTKRIEGLTSFEKPVDNSVDESAVKDEIESRAKKLPKRHLMVNWLAAASRTIPSAAKGKAAKPSSNELALGLLAATAKNAVFGDPKVSSALRIPDIPHARAYVLGPPRDAKLLKKDLPTKNRGESQSENEGKYKEVYLAGDSTHRTFELSPVLNVYATVAASSALPPDMRYPFVRSFRRPLPVSGARRRSTQSLARGDFSTPLKSTDDFIASSYFDPEFDWRRIDGDWLNAAEALALNLDSDTNNTSLALAFEWGAEGAGKVLLFPGDAQVGNWLSWRDQRYGANHKTISADDLLRRTILYKAGHHASHNGTVKRDPREMLPSDPLGAPFGLELMDDIIVMIPVDRDAADKEMPTPWEMPALPLYRRLRQKARNRVLRSDTSLTPLDPKEDDLDIVPQSTEWTSVPGLKNAKWRRSAETFEAGTAGPLYFDILFALPDS